MDTVFQHYQAEIIKTFILFGFFFIINLILKTLMKLDGKKHNKNKARIGLINRYITVTLLSIAILLEAFVLGAEPKDLALVFSSVFAVVGIALFGVWSILSNITSGIIMFFNFPYKVGDKIEIHDKDFPITAVIEDIRAFHLHLRIENGNLVTYPNNLMLQKAVTLIEKDVIDDDMDAI
tara:strand:- start:3069 stop:3605 length:537 start_codon:yes stop_codon:yes gene_type:complete